MPAAPKHTPSCMHHGQLCTTATARGACMIWHGLLSTVRYNSRPGDHNHPSIPIERQPTELPCMRLLSAATTFNRTAHTQILPSILAEHTPLFPATNEQSGKIPSCCSIHRGTPQMSCQLDRFHNCNKYQHQHVHNTELSKSRSGLTIHQHGTNDAEVPPQYSTDALAAAVHAAKPYRKQT